MGWLRLVGSLKLQVSFAEYSLFYRALLQKRPMISRSLPIVATPYCKYEWHDLFIFWGVWREIFIFKGCDIQTVREWVKSVDSLIDQHLVYEWVMSKTVMSKPWYVNESCLRPHRSALGIWMSHVQTLNHERAVWQASYMCYTPHIWRIVLHTAYMKEIFPKIFMSQALYTRTCLTWLIHTKCSEDP